MSKTSLNGSSLRNRSGDLAVCPEFSAIRPLHVFTEAPELALVESEELLREILRRIGDDPDREGLQETPARIIRSWKELYGGYEERAEDVLRTQFQAEEYGE